jgi:hypothetical protein
MGFFVVGSNLASTTTNNGLPIKVEPFFLYVHNLLSAALMALLTA